MTSLYIFVFAAIGILYAAYTRNKSQSDRLKSLQRRHEVLNPEIKYEYNRFNTKKERNTTISFNQGNFNLKTDIQNIRIANQTLVSKISSEYDNIPIQFDLVIQPFEKVLFEIEGYNNFDQNGIMILWSYGTHTKFPIEQIEELDFLMDVLPAEPRGVYLDLEAFKVDKAENSVLLNGKFQDGKDFKFSINYKSYLLEFTAPEESIKNFKNFRDFEELEIDET